MNEQYETHPDDHEYGEEYALQKKESEPWKSKIVGEEPNIRSPSRLIPRKGHTPGMLASVKKTKKERSKKADFLNCVCGAVPYIIQSKETQDWSVQCIKCNVGTMWYQYLDYARIAWNLHSKHSPANAEIYDPEVYGKRANDVSRFDFGLNKLIDPKKKKKTTEEKLKQFYLIDYSYLERVRVMLQIGMEFTGRDDLARYLNEEWEDSGEFQRNHEKWWRRFFTWEKTGTAHHIRIATIYEDPQPHSGDPDRPNKGRASDDRAYRPRRTFAEKSYNYSYRPKDNPNMSDPEVRKKERYEEKAKRDRLVKAELQAIEREKAIKKQNKLMEELHPEEFENPDYDIGVTDYSVYNKELLNKLKPEKEKIQETEREGIDDETLLFSDNLDEEE